MRLENSSSFIEHPNNLLNNLLRAKGFKSTKGREIILQELQTGRDHFNANSLHHCIKGIEFRPMTGSGQGILPVEVLPNLKVISMALFIGDQDEPVVWRGPLKHNAISQFLGEVAWGNLDFLITDLPPGTGDEPLSVAHLIKNVDGSIIVTTPQDVALLDSRKAVTFSRMLGIPVIGIVENMSGLLCPHCHEEIPLFKKGGGEKAAREMKVPFLGSIPIEPEMVDDCDRGIPFVIAHPTSKATEVFQEIAHRCMEHVGFKERQGSLRRSNFPAVQNNRTW